MFEHSQVLWARAVSAHLVVLGLAVLGPHHVAVAEEPKAAIVITVLHLLAVGHLSNVERS